jgi:hypothetical protein
LFGDAAGFAVDAPGLDRAVQDKKAVFVDYGDDLRFESGHVVVVSMKKGKIILCAVACGGKGFVVGRLEKPGGAISPSLAQTSEGNPAF